MAEENGKPDEDEVLELSALTPTRPRARIKHDQDPEGTIYELSVPGDFSPVDLRMFSMRVEEMDKLWERSSSAKRLPRAQEKRLDQLLDQLALSLIREVPPEVVPLIAAVDKRGLVVRFFVAASKRTIDAMGLEGMIKNMQAGSGV